MKAYIDSTASNGFFLNGVFQYPIFIPRAIGVDAVQLINVYDGRTQLTDPLHYIEWTLNGRVYNNQSDLMQALWPIVYAYIDVRQAIEKAKTEIDTAKDSLVKAKTEIDDAKQSLENVNKNTTAYTKERTDILINKATQDLRSIEISVEARQALFMEDRFVLKKTKWMEASTYLEHRYILQTDHAEEMGRLKCILPGSVAGQDLPTTSLSASNIPIPIISISVDFRTPGAKPILAYALVSFYNYRFHNTGEFSLDYFIGVLPDLSLGKTKIFIQRIGELPKIRNNIYYDRAQLSVIENIPTALDLPAVNSIFDVKDESDLVIMNSNRFLPTGIKGLFKSQYGNSSLLYLEKLA